MQLGNIRIRWISDGTFKLDGGAMFGVVPKTVWTRRYPCDERNYIPMALNSLLIETPDAKLLIDTGYGNKLTPKQHALFQLTQPPTLFESLAAAGVAREEIDFVVYSHMHSDHAGGGTFLDAAGVVQASFPRARHVMQAVEWAEASAPNIRSKHAYFPENWQAIEALGLIAPVSGTVELCPGVQVISTGGHSQGHQIIRMESEGQVALHMADLLPTHAHLNPLWVMAYDDYPMDSIMAKQAWLERAKAEGWWLTFYHDPEVLAGVWDGEGNMIKQVPGADALL